jgi:preprotein translocase subunit SecE
MSAQRRTATKRGATATAATPASSKRDGSQNAKPQQVANKPASKPTGGKAKAAEAKPHPIKRRVEHLERWYRETRAEMAKITWPDQETTRNLTIVVIGISVVMGLFLGGIDFILVKILEAI